MRGVQPTELIVKYLGSSLVFYFASNFLEVGAAGPKCNAANCKRPSCRCSGLNIPGGLHPEDIPQMVLVTFDDAVNWENWEYYNRLFPADGSRKNPNGCPISMTLFVSHNYTDYCMVRKLHARGVEIADHSVSHRVPHTWWAGAGERELAGEILNQRRNLAELAEIPVEDIGGWRSPFLQPTGDTMFEILYDNNFTYDATLTHPFPRNIYSPVLWPFTLDYPLAIGCNIKPCPKKRYPGFWEIPVVTLMDHQEQLPCAYADFCRNKPRNEDQAFQVLWKNFLRNYRTNRAPFYLNLHSLWMDTAHNLEAMDHFIQRLVAMDDVYITSIRKALQWMREPTRLRQAADFRPWRCDGLEPNEDEKIYCQLTYRPRTTAAPTTGPRRTGGTTKASYPAGFLDAETTPSTDRRRPWFLRNASTPCSVPLHHLLIISAMFVTIGRD